MRTALIRKLYLKPMHAILRMAWRACPGLLHAIFLSSILMSLSCLSPQSNRPSVSATPSSYSWNNLRVD
ncbi:MAG: hypothetical protein ACPL07_02910, partial [Candidatus Bathyarchaeia archaeon]